MIEGSKIPPYHTGRRSWASEKRNRYWMKTKLDKTLQMERKKKVVSSRRVGAFQKEIYRYYREHGRNLPWRKSCDPYDILISEIMLQQTQVQRVVEKYAPFIARFPDFHSLASAPLRDILMVWQGLGYNRRAIALRTIARTVVEEFSGDLPSDPKVLVTLPGIGKATASAISAFAFNQPTVFIETNIRTVFIHFFFLHRDNIKDAEMLPLVGKTLDTSNPREWYYALMDYGAMLKKTYQNPNRKSAHYHKQTPFRGSNREIRGMILRVLAGKPSISEAEIVRRLKTAPDRVRANLTQLQQEGFVIKRGKLFTIA